MGSQTHIVPDGPGYSGYPVKGLAHLCIGQNIFFEAQTAVTPHAAKQFSVPLHGQQTAVFRPDSEARVSKLGD